jgi:predicted Zn finger-like uncharacterized protein
MAMNLTCPVCQRTYRLDPIKIPAKISTVKCKTCRYPIPLDPPANKEKPASADKIKIKCQYCSKKYSINAKKIPPSISEVNCKKCGHSISLEPSPPVSDTPATAKNKITCLYCNKSYRIDQSKIPAGKETMKCKSCGHRISLKPKPQNFLTAKSDINPAVASKQSPKMSAKVTPLLQTRVRQPSPTWKKPWLLAAVLAIIVVGVTLIFTGSDFARLLSGQLAQKDTDRIESRHHPEDIVQPFMVLDLNVPLAIGEFERQFLVDETSLKDKILISFFKSSKIEKAQLFLYPDAKHNFLPVVLIHGSNRNSLKSSIDSIGLVKPLLVHLKGDSYRINKRSLPKKHQNDWPLDLYRAELLDQGAIIAPKTVISRLKSNGMLQKTQVAKIAARLKKPQSVAVMAIQIPDALPTGWQTKLNNHPALIDDPRTAVLAADGCQKLSQVIESLKNIDFMALELRVDEARKRTLSYTQVFRKGTNGRKVYRRLKSGAFDNLAAEQILASLINFSKDSDYQHRLTFKRNRLNLNLSWQAQNDEDFLTALAEAAFGQTVAVEMGLQPTKGRITARYANAPLMMASVDAGALQSEIPKVLEQSIFAGGYFDQGDNPRMTLKMRPFDLPNAALAELTYDVKAVLTSDGKDVLRPVVGKSRSKLLLGRKHPAQIMLNIQKGTPVKSLGTAKIHFNLELPTSVALVEFKNGESAGHPKSSNGVSVKLVRLEKDVAQIAYHGGQAIKLFAFDRSGRCLASGESIISSTTVSVRFHGIIDRLMVAVVKAKLDYPFEIAVDLTGSKKMAAQQPSRTITEPHQLKVKREFAS